MEEVTLSPGLSGYAAIQDYCRDETIFAQEDSAEYVYKVISGVVRVVNLLADGRRHIVSFYFAGEVFGLEAAAAHQSSAEAVISSRIASVRHEALENTSQIEARSIAGVWRLMAQELSRAQEHALALGRLTAEERVLNFLKEMRSHCSSGGMIALPMSRTDIADYLGLTIETVSRTFTQLERRGAICFDGARRIQLRSDREKFSVAQYSR